MTSRGIGSLLLCLYTTCAGCAKDVAPAESLKATGSETMINVRTDTPLADQLASQQSIAQLEAREDELRRSILATVAPSLRRSISETWRSGGEIGAASDVRTAALLGELNTVRAAKARKTHRRSEGAMAWLAISAQRLPNASVAIVIRRPPNAAGDPSNVILVSESGGAAAIVGAMVHLRSRIEREGTDVARAKVTALSSVSTIDSSALQRAASYSRLALRGQERIVPLIGRARGDWILVPPAKRSNSSL
jgi:hypothetical protein